MKLKTLSASSAKLFESCPSSWRTRYAREDGKRPAEQAGDAALLGTVVHATFETWVADGHHMHPYSDTEALDMILEIYEDKYWHEFSHAERFEAGKEMVVNWLQRMDWTGRTNITTERKSSFNIKTSQGTLPVYYVFDRIDRLSDGTIEVVDYKSGVRNVYADTLRNDIQARIYALAAQIEHPEAERIWVTFDMLRYSQVGVSFTKSENRQTLRYLEKLAERIIAESGYTETINPGCRWCVRRHVCETVSAHMDEGGPLAYSDIEDLAGRRERYALAIKAIEVMIADMDGAILDYAEDMELDEFTAGDVKVNVSASKSRKVDAETLTEALGDDFAEFVKSYGGLGVRNVDKAIKDGWGTHHPTESAREFIYL